MRFKDENILGLVVWGTKRGKNVFFSDNIADETEAIDNALYDIRTPVQFTGVNLNFYSFERNTEHYSFTMYRTIYDWANRFGYYAVSILIPSDKAFPAGNIPAILKTLSAMYWEKYIATSPTPNRIREDSKEDPRPLISELTNARQYLRQPQAANPVFGAQKCVLKFKDESDLESIFEHHLREELTKYGQVFVLPASQHGLVCNFETPPLKPIERTVNLTIKAFAVDEGEKPMTRPILTIYKGPERVFNDVLETGEYELTGLSLRDKVQIQVVKAGYLTKVLKESEIDLPTLFKDKNTKHRVLPIILNIDKSVNISGDLFKQQGQGSGRGGRINIDDITGKGTAKQPETKAEPEGIPEPNPEHPAAKPADKEAILSIPLSTPRPDVPGPIPVIKKESFGQQFRKWLNSNSTVVIGIGGATLFLLVILAIVISRTHLDKQESFNYTDLNTQIDEFKKEINFKSQQLWNSNQYEETIKFLQENQKKIDSLSQLSWISPDSLKHSREQMDEIRTSYKARIVSDRDSLLKGVDFDSLRTSLLIKACLDLGLEKSLDTMNLMRFARICYWINRSNEIINGLNTDLSSRERIKGDLNYILTDSKFLFLNEKQRDVVRSYKRVLTMMGTKVYANAEDFLARIVNQFSSGERQDISYFLKNRKNK